MNGKKVTRVVLDVALTAMIVAEMFIQYTGTFLHEVIGFAFFATVVVHLALSAKWIKTTAKNASKGKMTARRTALAVMGILLTVCMVVLGVSSVAISGILADAGLVWTLGSYATWKTIHAVSSYALCALVVIHLGMHWAFLASAFHVPYDPSRRRAISTGVHATAALGALALGAMAVGQALPRTTGTSTATQAARAAPVPHRMARAPPRAQAARATARPPQRESARSAASSARSARRNATSLTRLACCRSPRYYPARFYSCSKESGLWRVHCPGCAKTTSAAANNNVSRKQKRSPRAGRFHGFPRGERFFYVCVRPGASFRTNGCIITSEI